MPKLKSHSGAKKRFSVTPTGKVKCQAGHHRHRLVSKSTEAKRNACKKLILQPGQAERVKKHWLPYSV